MTKVFQLIAGGERLGKELKVASGVTTLEPGMLVKKDASGSHVSLGAVNDVFGIAYGQRYATYRPTSKVFAEGEPLTVIWGVGEALISSDFFSGGSSPSAGDDLYAQANGLWGMQGSLKVGDCIAIRQRVEPDGGVGVSQNLVHVRFNIQP